MNKPETRRIEEIIVRPNRVRKDLGDIAGLAASIVASDFMPPLLIDPFNELIDGRRRLEAAQLLGWKSVPVVAVPTVLVARGEIVAHNQKPFTWAEKVAIYRAVKPLVEDEAKDRRNSRLKRGRQTPVGENLPNGSRGRTRDRVADYCGDTSGKTLEQADHVFASGEDDLIALIERTGKVNKAYKKLQRRKRVKGVLDDPAPDDERLKLGDCLEILAAIPDNTFDAALPDPPFGVGFEYGDGKEVADNPHDYAKCIVPLFGELVRVVHLGGLVALWQSPRYVRYFQEWFGEDIRIFWACKRHVQMRDEAMAEAVDPIVCYWKPGAKPLRPTRQHGSVNFHVSLMQYDDLARMHPCPRPLDLCEHLIRNFVIEGGYIFDCFAGSGSILVAAQRLSHPWMGLERNPEYRALALKRLELYGDPGVPYPGQSDRAR